MIWESKTLGEISLSIQTGPFGSQLHQSDYSDDGTPVVMPKDLMNGTISEESIARVSKEHVERLEKYKIQEEDILYSRRGDVGRCAFTSEREKGWLCGTGCLKVRIDKEKAEPKFVFFQLQKAETISWVVNHAVGSTMLNLNTSILNAVPVDVPEIEIQRKIVSILAAYDELIENNQKQIKLLEEAAQRLYKEWFVDLRFPGYEDVEIVDGVPDGWTKDRAECFFKITIGKTPPRAEKQWFVNGNDGIPWISISDMGNAGVFTFKTSEGLTEEAIKKHNIKIVPSGTIFVSFKLTVGRVAIAATEMCTNEAIAHFYVNDSLQAYTYCYLSNFEYDTLGNTSSISKAVNSKIIKAMPFIMPSQGIVEKFSAIVSPILSEIKAKQKTCNYLSESRDRLLPKLMSGEIEV
ncbi:MAG: restriction endonuclease subunit S [Clostridiales bacterium]|nr:restriction endonuclease subunit S [Clostridiales bacterium]MDD7432426.1 restriction endonuclease subunit S [Clostridiales bacterium]MDY3061860.1 restriction endonuclease subunit S [Eubacteriales bacterium]